MRNYPIYYTMQVEIFEPYKQKWIKRTENVGMCLSKDEAVDKAFNILANLSGEQWRNFAVFNERNKKVYSV